MCKWATLKFYPSEKLSKKTKPSFLRVSFFRLDSEAACVDN